MADLRARLAGERHRATFRPQDGLTHPVPPWPRRPLWRAGLMIAGTVWFLYAMLREQGHPNRPQLGLQGTDLVLTVGSAAAAASFLLGLITSRLEKAYAAVFFLAGAGLGVMLYAVTPDRPASAVIFA